MISVLIPVKNGGEDLRRCLAGITQQEIVEGVEIVVVDSGSTDGSIDHAESVGARVLRIAADDFVHGSARNLAAREANGDLLVFTSQDAVAASPVWLASLAAAARSRPDAAGAYGRQLPHEGARPPERFFLDFLYGPRARVQRLAPDDELTFETTIFSNVNSAIPRAVWHEHPFGDQVTMSEDQEWSRRMLRAGRVLVYAPEAAVRHSHTYTLRSAFRRFYVSGVSAEHSYVEGLGSRQALRRAGLRYARRELRWLLATGQVHWLPYTILYELTKFAGLQLGIRHARLPRALAARLGR